LIEPVVKNGNFGLIIFNFSAKSGLNFVWQFLIFN